MNTFIDIMGQNWVGIARLGTPLQQTAVQRGPLPRWPDLSRVAWARENVTVFQVIKRRCPATLLITSEASYESTVMEKKVRKKSEEKNVHRIKKKYCYFVHRWGTSLFTPPPGSRVRRLGWSQYMHECIGASQGYHGVYRAAQTVLSRSV